MSAPGMLTCDEVRDLAPVFVIGALDPDEMDAVRGHLGECDDAHMELIEFGEAAVALLETVAPVAPPATLKARLMAAAAADLDEGRHPWVRTAVATTAPAPAAATAPARVVTSAPSNVIDFGAARERRRGRLAWLVAVAAVIGVVALGGLNLSLRRDLDAAQAYQDGVNQTLDLAAKPGSVTAFITSADGAASGFGAVGADGTVRLTMRGLAPTSGSQVYTAWSIVGDTAPVALGDFTVGADGVATATVTSPTAAPGATLALTLEPVPGAQAPAGPVVAAGVTRDPAG